MPSKKKNYKFSGKTREADQKNFDREKFVVKIHFLKSSLKSTKIYQKTSIKFNIIELVHDFILIK